jgi:hypothetical protein
LPGISRESDEGVINRLTARGLTEAGADPGEAAVCLGLITLSRTGPVQFVP